MLHRIKKVNDMHEGKWNGLGGKIEAGETPEECAIREVREESGLRMINPVLRGIITFPQFSRGDDWYTYIFVANEYSGELIDSNEGVLAWVDNDKLLELPMWSGDPIFMRWLNEPHFFSAKFVYSAGELANYEVVFYTQPLTDGSTIEREKVSFPVRTISTEPVVAEEVVGKSSKADSAWKPYSAEDDSYCWMCGGAVEKRHCKIQCLACGFMRDCSDP